MSNLSKYITDEEFLFSRTAVANKLINKFDKDEYRKNAVELCTELVDIIREYYGKPIHVNSGYRGIVLNQKVKGSKTSQHCSGQAIDITIPSVDLKQIFNDLVSGKIKDKEGNPLMNKIDQIIIENLTNNQVTSGSWIHISHTNNPRHQKMLAEFINKKPHYRFIDKI